MSKLIRDGTAEPVSRDQILRRERGHRILYFSCSTADHEQDWQPCPVVRAIHTNIVLHTHTAVATHVKKKGSVAFSLSTLRNMMWCARLQGT